ncbi:MAG: 16S rRNA (cytidine(1402)-2'-O)-methyltransferase [Silvibacterium sp.]|nr:16S rRNA (cytidine(1402)-2'-O)-methyltransferase [Silvibacterium sp.]
MPENQRQAGSEQVLPPGLYLVATPIGNLEDITLRALRVLRSVERIACEDTRQTQKLLNYYGIATATLSLHEHNEAGRTSELIADLLGGARIAVVSDAGIPGISDPGIFLTRAAITAEIPVSVIPGANAALTALVASGLNTERFFFLGFLPPKTTARRSDLEKVKAGINQPTTLIFYEAPHRIVETLGDIERVWGADCKVVIARELTKIHEEFLRGTVAEVREALSQRDRIRGEMVLLVEAVPQIGEDARNDIGVQQRIQQLRDTQGLDEMEALKRIARERGVSKSEVYRQLQRERAPK